MKIARLIPVPLREIWKHEALDFTRWLADNLDYLEEVTGMTINLVEREAPTGAFQVDLLAEDGLGNLVVIENQLESTNHDHLGKLITYISNHEAKTAIWITSQVRPEHEKAVHWLNETMPDDTSFFLLQIEAYKIGDSPPAPKFTVIAGPSPESRQIGAQRKELAERQVLRLEFWRQLLEKANKITDLHARISPSKDSWISKGSGKSGLGYNYIVLLKSGRVELYIDTPDTDTNKRIFETLLHQKDAIEAAFGAPLEWHYLEGRKASRIHYNITDKGGLSDRDSWSALQDAMIDAMKRLYNALDPHVRNLSY